LLRQPAARDNAAAVRLDGGRSFTVPIRNEVKRFVERKSRIPMEKSMRSQVLTIVVQIAVWVYGIQLFFILPMYSGEIYRHERAMWVWKQFALMHEKPRIGDALLEVYVYLIFYSGLFVVPFFVTMVRYIVSDGVFGRDQLTLSVMIAAWIAGTILLFPESVIQFLHYLPWDGPSGWLIIGWVAGRVYITYYAVGAIKRRTRSE
jgi:hypothetical protein